MKPDHFFGGRASPVSGDCVCLLRSYPPSYLNLDILFLPPLTLLSRLLLQVSPGFGRLKMTIFLFCDYLSCMPRLPCSLGRFHYLFASLGRMKKTFKGVARALICKLINLIIYNLERSVSNIDVFFCATFTVCI